MRPDPAAGQSLVAAARPRRPLPFVDVFCETNAFALAQSRSILEYAKAVGFPFKIHPDGFDNLGGASLAAELGAASADHLVRASGADSAPGAERHGRRGLALHALWAGRTALHPGAGNPRGRGTLSPSPPTSIRAPPGTNCMQFVIALACRYLKLTPAQAIAAATINAAAAIRRADRMGSITPANRPTCSILSIPDDRYLGYRFGTNLVQRVIKKGQEFKV